MSTKFAEFIEVATELITENGGPMTIEKYAGGAPSDPSQPWRPTAAAPTTLTVTGVKFPDEEAPPGHTVYISGADAPLTTDINESHVLLIGVDRFSINKATPINPDGGDVVLWTLSVSLWPPLSTAP